MATLRSKLREQVEMPYIFVPGVFLCRQSELFLAFRINHSHSRIVDKKTRPKTAQPSETTKPTGPFTPTKPYEQSGASEATTPSESAELSGLMNQMNQKNQWKQLTFDRVKENHWNQCHKSTELSQPTQST